MAFFKTKQEKEIIAKMEREEQMEVFNQQIAELKSKRQEYARIAAEAEVNGDQGSYDVAVNGLLEINDIISTLTQTKTNFDVINISNSIAVSMATAMNCLNKMASGKAQMPNLRKIQKTQLKMNKYMRDVKIAQKAMGSAMKNSNPANRTRSPEALNSVRPLIDAERAKMGPTINTSATMNLSEEIEREKNRII